MKLQRIAISHIWAPILITAGTQLVSAQSSGPLPSQLASAKTIFVAYDGAVMGTYSVPPNLIYLDLMQALKANARYTVTSKPADAELSMRLSFEASGVRLRTFDTKSGALLWTIEEPVHNAARKATVVKNINAAAMKLVTDLDDLAAGKLPGSN